jgi:Na+-driven multidrug efflux pump
MKKMGKLLWKFSIPAIIGMIVQGLYNIIDTLFVGRYAGMLGIGEASILSRFHSDFSHQASGSLFQSGISCYSYQVLNALQFKVIEEGGRGESAIEPDAKAGVGKCVLQPGKCSHQDSNRAARCRCISGP